MTLLRIISLKNRQKYSNMNEKKFGNTIRKKEKISIRKNSNPQGSAEWDTQQ